MCLLSVAIAWCAFGRHRPVPLLDWFDLAIHETGHLIAAPFPDVAMFLAGSVAQVLFPLAMAAYFGLRRRDTAAAGFCLAWAGTSAWDVSVYAGDAVAQNLPLVGGGQHDWTWILSHFGVLDRTADVAGAIENGGLLLAVAGIALGLAALLPARSRLIPAPSPRILGEDPWAQAARLPFRHEPGAQTVGSSPEGGGGVAGRSS